MKVLTAFNKQEIIFNIPDDLTGKDAEDSRKVIKETWLENVYQINIGDFNDNGIFIDIGANIGSVALYVAAMNKDENRKKDIRVIAYEPEPNNAAILAKNIHENKVENITAVCKGVFGTAMKAKISNRGGNSSLFYVQDTDSEIDLISLEDVFLENNITECDVLKMDIEGAELMTLAGASLETLQRIKYLCLEFDPVEDKNIEGFGLILTKLAEVYNLHIIGKPTTGGYIYGRRY